MRRLNFHYRGKDKPTDVLSFSLLEGEVISSFSNSVALIPVALSLGDIVISIPTATKQAQEYKVTLGEELLRLLIHGILHLFGYEHENVTRYKVIQMQKMEDFLFSKNRSTARSLVAR